MDYPLAIYKIDPAKTYNITGDDYASIIWNGDPILESDLISAYSQYLNSDGKQNLNDEILKWYDSATGQFITNHPSKASAYREKNREADLWQNGERDPLKIPIITETASALSVEPAVVAQRFIDAVNGYRVIGAKIEARYDYLKSELSKVVFVSDTDVENFKTLIWSYSLD